MRPIRILALTAAALVAVGLLAAPPASAVTTVLVNCATASTVDFRVTPGEEIGFQLNAACVEALDSLEPAVDSEPEFAAFISGIFLNRTGATLGTSWNGGVNPTVTYIAGSTPGTDSLVLSFALRARAYRALPGTNSYYMTVPRADSPTPWLQAVGRNADETCPTGYGPSWAEWMNAGTGGFVCVREYYYRPAQDDWAYRKG